MLLTKEQLAQLTAQIAEAKKSDVLSIAGAIGDSFNQTNLANAIARVEALSYINSQVTAAQRYAKLIPVNTTVKAEMGTALKREFTTAVGMGKRYSGSGKDIPLVEVIYGEQYITVEMGSIGYQYTIAELRAASLGNVSLATDKPAAARLGFERHMYQVAMVGDIDGTKKGLINHEIPEVILSPKRFAASTPKEIIQLISDAIGVAYDDAEVTGDTSNLPNTILFPSKIYRYLNDTMMSETSETSILSYLKANNLLSESGVGNVEFDSLPELNKAGADGQGRIVIYLKDSSAIEFIIPEDLTYLAPQPDGLEVLVPGFYVYAGVWIKTPKAITYIDGV